jgi:hypothetical protein
MIEETLLAVLHESVPGTLETCRPLLEGLLIGIGLIDANDAVDGAQSAASKCHRVVALEQTKLRGAVHERGWHDCCATRVAAAHHFSFLCGCPEFLERFAFAEL